MHQHGALLLFLHCGNAGCGLGTAMLAQAGSGVLWLQSHCSAPASEHPTYVWIPC